MRGYGGPRKRLETAPKPPLLCRVLGHDVAVLTGGIRAICLRSGCTAKWGAW